MSSIAGAKAPLPRRIVICGGGVIGVCTAYFLALKGSSGVSITVVERSSVACAASGKAGGFLALDWCDGSALSDLARTSFLLHRSLSDLLDGSRAYGYRVLTALSLALSSSKTGSRSPALPSWIDGAAAGKPQTIGTLDTTAQVHPQLFARAVMAFAKENYGVKVVIGEVQSVDVESIGGVALRDGRILQADVAVIAMGPWSGRLRQVSDLFNVFGSKVHSIILRPPDPGVISPHALFLRYQPGPGQKPLNPEVYPRPTGEVYICGASKHAVPPDDPEEIRCEAESISTLHDIAMAVSSHLRPGSAAVVAEQACFLPCTEDDLPVIGEMPGSNKSCYIATGHSCWGILNGPATGAALAELILDGRSSTVDLQPFSPARFLRQ